MTCELRCRGSRNTSSEPWQQQLPEKLRERVKEPNEFERFDDPEGDAHRVVGRDRNGEICYQRSAYATFVVHSNDEYDMALMPAYVRLEWSWRIDDGRWLSLLRERAGVDGCSEATERYAISASMPR